MFEGDTLEVTPPPLPKNRTQSAVDDSSSDDDVTKKRKLDELMQQIEISKAKSAYHDSPQTNEPEIDASAVSMVEQENPVAYPSEQGNAQFVPQEEPVEQKQEAQEEGQYISKDDIDSIFSNQMPNPGIAAAIQEEVDPQKRDTVNMGHVQQDTTPVVYHQPPAPRDTVNMNQVQQKLDRSADYAGQTPRDTVKMAYSFPQEESSVSGVSHANIRLADSDSQGFNANTQVVARTRTRKVGNLTLTVGVQKDQGQRKYDEDNHLVSLENLIFAVADGVGGHLRGDEASKAAVDIMKNFYHEKVIINEKKSKKERRGTISILDDATETCHEVILGKNGLKKGEKVQSSSYDMMGTTLTTLAVSGNKAYIAHVGDSRIYRFRRNPKTKKLEGEQLTEDHDALTQSLKLAKDETEKQDSFAYWKNKNVLTQAVGMPHDAGRLEVCKRTEKIKDKDIYLLCSDGLTKPFTNHDDMKTDTKKIGEIIDKHIDSPQKCCDALVSAALEGGSDDNITAMIVSFENKGFDYTKILKPVAAAATLTAFVATVATGGYLTYDWLSNRKSAEVAKPTTAAVQVVEKKEDIELARLPAYVPAPVPLPEKLTPEPVVPAPQPVEVKPEPVVPTAVAEQVVTAPAPVQQQESLDALEQACRDTAHERFVKIIKDSKPRSKVRKYNLLPDSSGTPSDQWAINAGTYEANKNAKHPWKGGKATKAQRERAKKYILDHTGNPVMFLTLNRASEFTIRDINPRRVDAGIVPECRPYQAKITSEKGSNDHIDDRVLPGELRQGPNSDDDRTRYAAVTDDDSILPQQEYSAVQRTVIEHLYKEFAFGKKISESQMAEKASEYGIHKLTASSAKEVYLNLALARDDVDYEPEILLTEVVDDNEFMPSDEFGPELLLEDILYEPVKAMSRDAENCLKNGQCELALPEYTGDSQEQWALAKSTMDKRVADYKSQQMKQQWEASCKNRNLADQWKNACKDREQRFSQPTEYRLAA